MKDGKQGDALRAEIKEICRKENLMHPDEWRVDFWEQPTSCLLYTSRYTTMKNWCRSLQYRLPVWLQLLPRSGSKGMVSSPHI